MTQKIKKILLASQKKLPKKTYFDVGNLHFHMIGPVSVF